jgi:hypothetical protein
MSSTQVFFHHTEIGSTDFHEADYGQHINAELVNRNGGSIQLFFDCVDDVERLAEELRFMAEGIRAQEPKDVCAETGEVLV